MNRWHADDWWSRQTGGQREVAMRVRFSEALGKWRWTCTAPHLPNRGGACDDEGVAKATARRVAKTMSRQIVKVPDAAE